ncbi:hypothetical protein CXG81DRAFT_10296 [Caulochytrium protostelioides]|uniref:NADH dehydrogenase [ubiquinone] 1 alpha subcomplex subunit 1 n=1 Tax=Caulochytrium protostelioides TaxID=1555241 RepID=A0A4V1IV51_9FUNG|nr:hypothetical protein CXG81DRAFT_10296 [Caulochytrium protostelioides]|eukprot:RKP02839.1 hypothetical protein CXG81DRAFT_10296 [Caulochytrium protostelioides]
MPIPTEAFASFAIVGIIGFGGRYILNAFQHFENDGKSRRWNVDKWDRQMMERDARMTGNVNRQLAQPRAPRQFSTNSALELEKASFL